MSSAEHSCLRVAADDPLYRLRGRPQHCEECGKTGPGLYHWANLTGKYHDENDYRRMCATCHRRFDLARKAKDNNDC